MSRMAGLVYDGREDLRQTIAHYACTAYKQTNGDKIKLERRLAFILAWTTIRKGPMVPLLKPFTSPEYKISSVPENVSPAEGRFLLDLFLLRHSPKRIIEDLGKGQKWLKQKVRKFKLYRKGKKHHPKPCKTKLHRQKVAKGLERWWRENMV